VKGPCVQSELKIIKNRILVCKSYYVANPGKKMRPVWGNVCSQGKMFVIRPTLIEPDPFTLWPCDTALYCWCAEILSSSSREVCWKIQLFGTRKVLLNLYKAKMLF